MNALIEGIIWLLDNPDEWAKMLDVGRNHVETKYDARKQGIKLKKLYESLIQNSSEY